MEKTANIRIHWYDRDNGTDHVADWTGVSESVAETVSDILDAVEDNELRQAATKRFVHEVGLLIAHYMHGID